MVIFALLIFFSFIKHPSVTLVVLVSWRSDHLCKLFLASSSDLHPNGIDAHFFAHIPHVFLFHFFKRASYPILYNIFHQMVVRAAEKERREDGTTIPFVPGNTLPIKLRDQKKNEANSKTCCSQRTQRF